MVFMFEIAPPFRLRAKMERFGPMTRVIWGWFSVSYIAAGVNDIARAFRLAERERWTLLLTDKWHDGEGKGQTLAQYMGMTDDEYGAWVRGPNVKGQATEPLLAKVACTGWLGMEDEK